MFVFSLPGLMCAFVRRLELSCWIGVFSYDIFIFDNKAMASPDEILLVKLMRARDEAYEHAGMLAEVVKIFEDPKVRKTLAMRDKKLIDSLKPHCLIGRAVESYLTAMRLAGASQRTLNNYKSQLRPLFDRKMGISRDDLAALLERASANKSAKSRATQMSIVRNFFAWAHDTNLIAENPFATPLEVRHSRICRGFRRKGV